MKTIYLDPNQVPSYLRGGSKAELITMGYLNKAGAITNKGRNAR